MASPTLARVAIAVADHLFPLTPEQRDDVLVRVACLIDDPPIPHKPTTKTIDVPLVDGTPVKARLTPTVFVAQPSVTACDDVPQPSLEGKPIPMATVPVDPAALPAFKSAVVNRTVDHLEADGHVAPNRPARARVSAESKPVSSATEAVARSIVEVLSGHPNGMSKGQLATALNFEVGSSRLKTALDYVTHSARIRAEGNTNGRRYFPATKGA